MKYCTKCGLDKPFSEFNKNRSSKDKLQAQCNACRKTYRQNNTDKIKIDNKKWRETNIDYTKAKAKTYYNQNKQMAIARANDWKNNNPERRKEIARNSHIKRKYGITIEQESQLKQLQNNKCAICKNELQPGFKSHIDHCHTTGKIRAILCNTCNAMLGMAKESPEILKFALNYLKKYNSKKGPKSA